MLWLFVLLCLPSNILTTKGYSSWVIITPPLLIICVCGAWLLTITFKETSAAENNKNICLDLFKITIMSVVVFSIISAVVFMILQVFIFYIFNYFSNVIFFCC